jgi:AcrR family transcriptional regulator
MAKAFTETERQAIRAQLQAAALRRFARQGVRAARVEDICRDVGIAKGSFYAFYPGKEELFMAIADAREARHREEVLAFVAAAEGSPAVRAGQFFDMLMQKIETDPVLGLIMQHGEIAHLTRKLGPERMRQGQESDRAFVAEVARRWQGRPLDATALLGLLTLMLSLAVNRGAMTTEEQYRPTVRLLREMFIDKLVGGAT